MSARDVQGTVLVMAGGTGGHVFPALAVARRLRELGLEVVWLGTPTGLEARVVPEAGFPFEAIKVRGLRGSGWKRLLVAPLRVTAAVVAALGVVRRVRPCVLLGFGGFVTGPGGLAGWLSGRPLLIHEQNAIAGFTNKTLARFARRVMEAFPGSLPAGPKLLHTGNPVRAEIAALAAPAERLAGRDGPLRLLVVGGSLGAQALNERLPAALALLPEERRPVVRHQAGGAKQAEAEQAYRAAGVEAEVLPFIEDMAAAYAWADLVVCRAGALTVAELAAAGVASVLVPYPFAVDDHQTANAHYLADAGAAVLIQQRDLNAERLAGLLGDLAADRARLRSMAVAARALAKTDATEQVAAECLAICRQEAA